MTPTTAIFGAGAIGGVLAHGLAKAGHAATLIARGERQTAIASKGITLTESGDQTTVSVPVTDDTAALGPQDVVFLALKQHQIADALPSIRPLIGPKTNIIPAINGIPWWYFEGLAGAQSGENLKCLDPNGTLAGAFPVENLIGCVVYIAAETKEYTEIDSLGFRKLILGRPDGTADPVLEQLSAMLNEAGFKTPISGDIRRDVWMKIWGNIWANPLSVLMEAGMGEMYDDAALRDIGMNMMRDAGIVAGALGIEIPITPEKRMNDAARFGGFKTSMLQDFERGRAIELDGIVGAVCEIGRKIGVATPTLDIIYALTRHRAARMGCYQEPK